MDLKISMSISRHLATLAENFALHCASLQASRFFRQENSYSFKYVFDFFFSRI